MEQKIKEYFENKEIGTLKTQIEDIEEMLELHETDIVQIRNMLDVIENGFEDEDEERELENDHVCKHGEGCLAELFKTPLPNRINFDWVQCSNEKCKNWYSLFLS